MYLSASTDIANPLFGTTTMHVAALFAAWGDDRAKELMTDLKGNDVRIASSNGEVKRLVVAGEVAFGLTDTDDANEAIKEGAPVEVVYPDQEDALAFKIRHRSGGVITSYAQSGRGSRPPLD